MDQSHTAIDPIQQQQQPTSNDTTNITTTENTIGVTDSKPQLVESKLITDFEANQDMVYATLEKVAPSDCVALKTENDVKPDSPPKCDAANEQQPVDPNEKQDAPAIAEIEAGSGENAVRRSDSNEDNLKNAIDEASNEPQESKITDDDFSSIHDVPSELIEAALSKANNIMQPLMSGGPMHKIDLKDVDDLITNQTLSESKETTASHMPAGRLGDLREIPAEFLTNSQVEQVIADVEKLGNYEVSSRSMDLDAARVEKEKEIESIRREIIKERDFEPSIPITEKFEVEKPANEDLPAPQTDAEDQQDKANNPIDAKKVVEEEEEEEIVTPEPRQEPQQHIDLNTESEEKEDKEKEAEASFNTESVPSKPREEIETKLDAGEGAQEITKVDQVEANTQDISSFIETSHAFDSTINDEKPLDEVERRFDSPKPIDSNQDDESAMEVEDQEPTTSEIPTSSPKKPAADSEKNTDSGVEDESQPNEEKKREAQENIEQSCKLLPESVDNGPIVDAPKTEENLEVEPEEGAGASNEVDKAEKSAPVDEPKVEAQPTRRQSRRQLNKPKAEEVQKVQPEEKVAVPKPSKESDLEEPSAAIESTATKAEEESSADSGNKVPVEQAVSPPPSKRGRAKRAAQSKDDDVATETTKGKSNDDSDDKEEDQRSTRRSTRTLRTRLPKRPAEEEEEVPKPVKSATASKKQDIDQEELEPEKLTSEARAGKATPSRPQKKIKLQTPAIVREAARRKTENLESIRTPAQDSQRSRTKLTASTTSKIGGKHQYVITKRFGCIHCGDESDRIGVIHEHKKRCPYLKEGASRMMQMVSQLTPKGNKKRPTS